MTTPRLLGSRRRRFQFVAYSSASEPKPELEIAPKHSLIYTLSGPQEHQNKCPLFSTMPPEIRNMIFALALSSYDDKSRPYPDNAYYSRPGYRFHQLISTSLLSTCRQIYCETHYLPVSLNEHVFWGSGNRGPKRRFSDNPTAYFKDFTEEQKAALVQIHLFTQLFWLESSSFTNMCKTPYMRPRYMKITIRHTDWWFWEDNTRLAMKAAWVDSLQFIHGLETFEVELETMERDKDQLETIVKTMFKWQISLADSRTLTTDGNTVKRERYLGQSLFSNADGTCVQYFTDRSRWRRLHRSIGTANPLPYVVTTLLWTAKPSK